MRTCTTDFGKAITSRTSTRLSVSRRLAGGVKQLRDIEQWLKTDSMALRAYIAGISPRLFTQRATAILSADVLALPYSEDRDLDLSVNERIIASDIVEHQRDFIRLGAGAPIMRTASIDA